MAIPAMAATQVEGSGTTTRFPVEGENLRNCPESVSPEYQFPSTVFFVKVRPA